MTRHPLTPATLLADLFGVAADSGRTASTSLGAADLMLTQFSGSGAFSASIHLGNTCLTCAVDLDPHAALRRVLQQIRPVAFALLSAAAAEVAGHLAPPDQDLDLRGVLS